MQHQLVCSSELTSHTVNGLVTYTLSGSEVNTLLDQVYVKSKEFVQLHVQVQIIVVTMYGWRDAYIHYTRGKNFLQKIKLM